MANDDIESIVSTVMMQAARSAEDDLRMIMAEVKAINAAKAHLRAVLTRVQRDATKNARRDKDAALDFSAGLGNEAAYHAVPMPVPDVDSRSGVTLVETDLAPGKITSVDQIRDVVNDLKNQLDTMSELGEMESLRLQMAMDRMSKLMSTLSNLLKKISDTSQGITQNLK